MLRLLVPDHVAPVERLQEAVGEVVLLRLGLQMRRPAHRLVGRRVAKQPPLALEHARLLVLRPRARAAVKVLAHFARRDNLRRRLGAEDGVRNRLRFFSFFFFF